MVFVSTIVSSFGNASRANAQITLKTKAIPHFRIPAGFGQLDTFGTVCCAREAPSGARLHHKKFFEHSTFNAQHSIRVARVYFNWLFNVEC
jgi:hypothetical protein